MTIGREPIRNDYTKINNVNVELSIRDAMNKANMNFFDYIVYVDKIGRIFVKPIEGGHRKVIGVVNADGTANINPEIKKTPKQQNRTSISIYVNNDDYERIARAAAMKGKNLSSFVREILLAHCDD